MSNINDIDGIGVVYMTYGEHVYFECESQDKFDEIISQQYSYDESAYGYEFFDKDDYEFNYLLEKI